MQDLVFILFLSTVQGLTEFLPVSSTGHLILIERFFNLSPVKFGLSFDIALHFGTLLALVIYFKNKLTSYAIDFIKGKRKIGWLLIFGTIPAVIVGVLFESSIRGLFRNPIIIAINLAFFSLIFWLAEKISRKQKDFQRLSCREALFIGFFQAIAFLPGVSRSGITISGGLFRNLKKQEAAEFTFLLSIPIILIASIRDIFMLVQTGFPQELVLNFVGGSMISFFVGYFCIIYFLSYLKKHGLGPFIFYRIILSILIIYFFM